MQLLSGSLNVTSAAPLNLDVFASLSLVVSTNDNPVTVTMDFMNTGQFRVNTAPGVSFSSASGVFLSQAAPVPEPASWAMLAFGLTAIGAAAKKRRRRA